MRPRIIADGAGATMRFLERNHPRVAHSIPIEQTCSVERRLVDVDRLGIDCQLLFPNHSGVYTEITDAGLVHLKGLTKLELLNLNRSEITDAGLSHLKKLTNLQTLFLKDTKVTDAGIPELQEALPNCETTK